jgi:hypothetical protein
VLGSSKAANAACLAAFDPGTDSALSRQPECVRKHHMALHMYDPLRLMSVFRGHIAARSTAIRSPCRAPDRQVSKPVNSDAYLAGTLAHISIGAVLSYRVWPRHPFNRCASDSHTIARWTL